MLDCSFLMGPYFNSFFFFFSVALWLNMRAGITVSLKEKKNSTCIYTKTDANIHLKKFFLLLWCCLICGREQLVNDS